MNQTIVRQTQLREVVAIKTLELHRRNEEFKVADDKVEVWEIPSRPELKEGRMLYYRMEQEKAQREYTEATQWLNEATDFLKWDKFRTSFCQRVEVIVKRDRGAKSLRDVFDNVRSMVLEDKAWAEQEVAKHHLLRPDESVVGVEKWQEWDRLLL